MMTVASTESLASARARMGWMISPQAASLSPPCRGIQSGLVGRAHGYGFEDSDLRCAAGRCWTLLLVWIWERIPVKA